MKKMFYLLAMFLIGMSMALVTGCSDDDDDDNGNGSQTTEKWKPVQLRVEDLTGATAPVPATASEEVVGDDVTGDDEGEEEYYGSWRTYDLTWNKDGQLRLVAENSGDMLTPAKPTPGEDINYAFTYEAGKVIINYNMAYGNEVEKHVITLILNEKGYVSTAEETIDEELWSSYKFIYHTNGMLEKFQTLPTFTYDGSDPKWEDAFVVSYGDSQNFSTFRDVCGVKEDEEGYPVYQYGNWTCTFGQLENGTVPNVNLLAMCATRPEPCFLLASLAGLLPSTPNCITQIAYGQQYVNYKWQSSEGKISSVSIDGESLDSPQVTMTYTY